jgi:hypothetical protein
METALIVVLENEFLSVKPEGDIKIKHVFGKLKFY